MEWLKLVISLSVTIIGLGLTYHGITKNFQNEVMKMKRKVAVDKMQDVPCRILQLIQDYKNQEDSKILIEKNISLLNTILAYGSKETIKLMCYIQQIAYACEKQKNLLKERQSEFLSAYALLIAQVKFDLTFEIIPPTSYFEMFLKDYNDYRESFNKSINAIVDRIGLLREFKILPNK